MTLTTFQKLLSELLAQYNQEAENHSIEDIKLTPTIPYKSVNVGSPITLVYKIEIKTIGK